MSVTTAELVIEAVYCARLHLFQGISRDQWMWAERGLTKADREFLTVFACRQITRDEWFEMDIRFNQTIDQHFAPRPRSEAI